MEGGSAGAWGIIFYRGVFCMRSRASALMLAPILACALAPAAAFAAKVEGANIAPYKAVIDSPSEAATLNEIGYGGAAVIELEYEDATAVEVRPDLGRAKELLSRDFAVA